VRNLVVTLLLTGVVSALSAQQGPIESLVSRSPFLPPNYRVNPPVTPPPPPQAPTISAASRFELIGVVSEDGVVSVSLRKRGEPRGTWLAPGEMVDDVKFIRFHLANREAVVDTKGRRETVPLKSSSIQAMPAAPPIQQRGPTSQTVTNDNNQPTGDETIQIPVRRRVIVPPK